MNRGRFGFLLAPWLRGAGLILIAIVGSTFTTAQAPGSAKNSVAAGPAERIMSAIHVDMRNGDRIRQVIRRLGEPASTEDAVVPDGAGGTRFYTWQFSGLKMSAATFFYYRQRRLLWLHWRSIRESRVAYADVWGDAPQGTLGMTGRGLALGSTLEQQKSIYGERYTVRFSDPKTGIVYVEIWWDDNTCLMVDYGPDGRSHHLRLTSKD